MAVKVRAEVWSLSAGRPLPAPVITAPAAPEGGGLPGLRVKGVAGPGQPGGGGTARRPQLPELVRRRSLK